jgi:hypothetical protein
MVGQRGREDELVEGAEQQPERQARHHQNRRVTRGP